MTEAYLSFDEFVEVLNRFRLRRELAGERFIVNIITHIVKDSLHKRDSNLCLLHEIILSVLNLQTGMFLLGRTSVLQPKREEE
jgi:hypothetical protein